MYCTQTAAGRCTFGTLLRVSTARRQGAMHLPVAVHETNSLSAIKYNRVAIPQKVLICKCVLMLRLSNPVYQGRDAICLV